MGGTNQGVVFIQNNPSSNIVAVENDYHDSNFRSRMWLEFSHQMWPPSLKGDSTLLNNDLKNLICGKNSKLRAGLVQLERIRLALKQNLLGPKQRPRTINTSAQLQRLAKNVRAITFASLVLRGHTNE